MSKHELTDLVCDARQRTLSESEAFRLQSVLESSSEAYLMSVVLCALDQDSASRPGDEDIIARIAAGATSHVVRISKRSHRIKRVSFGASGMVLLCGALAGAWGATARTSGQPTAVATTPSSTRTRVRQMTAMPPPANDAPASSSSTLESQPTLTPQRAVTAPDPSSVSEVFRRANLMRREGDPLLAKSLYLRIITEYPTSREATLARLAVAKLEADANPAKALALYRRVERDNDKLRAEALWGIAESARRLGQRTVEREALTTIVRRFPDSPYGGVALQRLEDGSD